MLGVVLYDQATTLDSYTDRDVERIEPGAEAPIVGGVRTTPLVAQVEKFGGKFVMTAEAIRRNDQSRMRNQMRRLANTITRKMHQRGWPRSRRTSRRSAGRPRACPGRMRWR
jgi:hypothetical protein